ncbi:MAG: hypothetical protein K5893_10175 [Prevotella sp.]|nr:hypothetical protein [Prevotella sp.]
MRTYLRRIAALVLLLATFCVAQAQNTIADTELKQLVDIVKRLRTPSEAQQKKAYEAAIKPLADDTRWTPMNELRDENGAECRPADKTVKRFRLNTLLNKAERRRNGLSTSTDNFLNGQDEAYNYSLYEKSIKAGNNHTARYRFHGRQGQQTFVFVPFAQSGTDFSVKLMWKDKAIGTTTRQNDGTLVLTTKERIGKDDTLTLEISNNGSAPISLVILNHNTRK